MVQPCDDAEIPSKYVPFSDKDGELEKCFEGINIKKHEMILIMRDFNAKELYTGLHGLGERLCLRNTMIKLSI